MRIIIDPRVDGEPWDITYAVEDDEIVPLETIMSLLVMFNDFPVLFNTTLDLAVDIYGDDIRLQLLRILSRLNIEESLNRDGMVNLLRAETSLIPNVEIGHV